MTMNTSTHPSFSAACYCGAVNLRFSAKPRGAVHCHCGECRRLSGGAFTTWVSMQHDSMSISGKASISIFSVSPNVTRHFCKVCGSHVYSTDIRLPNIAGIPAGIIEGDILVRPTAHYFIGSKAAWHTITDELPQFGGESGVEPTAA